MKTKLKFPKIGLKDVKTVRLFRKGAKTGEVTSNVRIIAVKENRVIKPAGPVPLVFNIRRSAKNGRLYFNATRGGKIVLECAGGKKRGYTRMRNLMKTLDGVISSIAYANWSIKEHHA